VSPPTLRRNPPFNGFSVLSVVAAVSEAISSGSPANLTF